MQLDRMMYLVISIRQGGPIIYEVELSRMSLVQVAKDIRDDQYGEVLAVIELNPEEHICREVTHDFEPLLGRRAD